MEIIIKVFISTIILCMTFLISEGILLEEKTKISQIKIILILVVNSIIMSINHLMVNNITKVLLWLIDLVVLSKIIYKKEMSKGIVISVLYYITVMLSEIIAILAVTVLYSILSLGNVESVKNSIFITITISILTIIFIKINKNKYRKILAKIQNNNLIILWILSSLILIYLISIFTKIDIGGWNLNEMFVIDTLIIVITCTIGTHLIIERINYEKIENQYKDLAKYSEINATLLEEYSMLNHEHKNQLIIIKGMIDENNKELKNYINTLLNKGKNIKFKWIRDLNNITFLGIKSFLNYKILEILDKNIKINVTVSSDCKNIKLENLNDENKDKLYSIIGILLDNAKDAANASSSKEIIINIFIENNHFIFEFANTYLGEIDIEKINNYGYSTKGAGHGTGLYMVQKITNSSEIFNINTTIVNKYFIQRLEINLKKGL